VLPDSTNSNNYFIFFSLHTWNARYVGKLIWFGGGGEGDQQEAHRFGAAYSNIQESLFRTNQPKVVVGGREERGGLK
jgi:hypothetical protein